MTEIGRGAFYGCKSLKEIRFDGTMEQWDAVEKGEDWDKKERSYVMKRGKLVPDSARIKVFYNSTGTK